MDKFMSVRSASGNALVVIDTWNDDNEPLKPLWFSYCVYPASDVPTYACWYTQMYD